MLHRTLVFFTLLLALAGCAGNKTAPKDVFTTTLTIPLMEDKWEQGTAQLALKNERGCGVFSSNILPLSFVKDFSYRLEDDKDNFFHLVRSNTKSTCDVSGVFFAKKGNSYFLNVDIANNSCKIFLIEKSPDGKLNKINTYPVYISNPDGNKVCLNKDRLYQ